MLLSEWPPLYADARTLKGKLQRGLGSGFLEALEAPAEVVHELLTRCVQVDPRCDGQIDDRVWYYGEIARRTELPVAPILDFIRDCQSDPKEDSYLAYSVLIHMARRGHRFSEQALLDYVTWGPYWIWVLREVGTMALSEDWMALVPLLADRAERDADAIAYDEEPFVTWGLTDPRFVEPATEKSKTGQTRRSVPNRTSEELLTVYGSDSSKSADELARRNRPEDRSLVRDTLKSDIPFSRAMAALVLAKQGDFSGLSVAQEILSRRKSPSLARRLAIQALALGPAEITLPLARRWRSSPMWSQQVTAFDILQEHADANDYEWVTRKLRRTSAERDSERFVLTNLAEVITARYPGREFPLLGRRFDAFTYSYGRHFLAEALAVTDPTFATTRAFTSLWDCESETRRIAAQHVDLGIAGVVERLREMAADPLEMSERVTEVATKRLETA